LIIIFIETKLKLHHLIKCIKKLKENILQPNYQMIMIPYKKILLNHYLKMKPINLINLISYGLKSQAIHGGQLLSL